jgi:ribosomal protein S18 acetylase RimI-like enzyme
VLGVTIRQATADDADAIADLVASVEPHLLVSEISRDERRDRFHRLLDTGQNVSFVAEAGGELVGELTFVLGNPNPTAIGFGVHPAWRRRGVARLLLEHGLAWADERNVHKLTAEVFAHNEPALSLLHQYGFNEEGYLVNQFRRKAGGATDAVLLARSTT